MPRPVLASQKITARLIEPGQLLLFKEGAFVVIKSGYGDPHELGFISLDGLNMATPWVIELEGDRKFVCHPGRDLTVQHLPHL